MPSAIKEATVSVDLQRLDVGSQTRLDWLLDQNSEGRLTPDECQELQRLVAQYENILLQNTAALLCAIRPDLMETSGQISQTRLTKAARRTARLLRQSSGS